MKKLLFYVLLSFFMVSCGEKTELEKQVKILKHKNGLVLQVNKTVNKIVTTDAGYKIDLALDKARRINEIEIKKLDSPGEDISSFSEKKINDTEYFYNLESFNVGSGGTEYTLRIWKPEAKGGILLIHDVQQETEPSFNEAWTIIQAIKKPPN